MQTRRRLRLRAAAWGAAVALIPAAIAANRWLAPDGLGEAISMGDDFNVAGLTLLAAASAAVSSYLIAWPLIDSETQHDGVAAAARGVVTVLLAYFLFCWIAYLFMYASLLPYLYAVQQEGQVRPLDDLGQTLVLPFYGMFYGLIESGWYTLPVGGIAGWALSRRYRA